MASLEVLRGLVSDVLQDESSEFSDDRIDALLNAAVDHVASTVLLPPLESVGDVMTEAGVSEVAIPEDWNFHRNLYAAKVESSAAAGEFSEIRVYDSLSVLSYYEPGALLSPAPGSVRFIVPRANAYLNYAEIPSDPQRIRCRFYRRPVHMTRDSDVPDGISDVVYQEQLLVSYALWKLFALIEDGVEGPMPNTKYYKQQFFEALAEYDSLIDHGQSRPEPNRESDWI